MTTPTVPLVRANLATIADTLTGWFGDAHVGDSVTAGCIKVSRLPFDPRYILSGSKCEHTFRMTAYAQRVEAITAEDALDALCELSGSGSLKVAVELSSNWTVDVDIAQLILIGQIVPTTYGPTDTTEYLACPFDVKVVY